MQSPLIHVPFDSVWKMRIHHPYSVFIRDGNLLWSCGQCPFNPGGEVLCPNDLHAQARITAEYIDHFLRQVGCNHDCTCQLVVYYVRNEDDDDGEKLQAYLHKHFGPDIIIILVSVPYFYYEGMMIEIDFFGSTRPKDYATLVDSETLVRLNILKSDDSTWATLEIPTGQASWQGALDRLFRKTSLSTDHLLSQQWFATRDDLMMQTNATVTDALLDRPSIVKIARKGFDAVGHFIFSKKTISRVSLRTEQHAVQVVNITYTTDGQFFEVFGRSTENSGLVEQTKRIMQAMNWTLRNSGLSFEDVRKATTYYVASRSEEDLHDNMSVRNRYYSQPGPASTGIPINGFISERSLISMRIFGKRPDIHN